MNNRPRRNRQIRQRDVSHAAFPTRAVATLIALVFCVLLGFIAFRHHTDAVTLNNQAYRLSQQGRYAEAHEVLMRSLKLKSVKGKRTGKDSLGYALTLMNLADNYLDWGKEEKNLTKLDEAQAAGTEALKIRLMHKDPEAKYCLELFDAIGKARRQLMHETSSPEEADD